MSVITCAGHIAAETANCFCLYLYMAFVFLLLMVEGAVTADVFLNRDWKEDFPEDPSGEFSDFINFVKLNFVFCKWIALSIVFVQGLSFLLAVVLRVLGPHRYYDSDDEYASDRHPLLQNSPPYDPRHGTRNDNWNTNR